MALNRINILVLRGWRRIARAYRVILREIIVFWRWITGQTRRKHKELADVFNRALRTAEVVETVVGKKKRRVPGRIVKMNKLSVWVELPNGDTIKRKLPRHLISDGVVNEIKRGNRTLSYDELVAYGKGEL